MTDIITNFPRVKRHSNAITMDLSPTTNDNFSPTGKKFRFGNNSPIRNTIEESPMQDEGSESNQIFKRTRSDIENINNSQTSTQTNSNGLFFRSQIQTSESLGIEHLRQINNNLNEHNHHKSTEIYEMKLKMEEMEQILKQSIDENKMLKRAVTIQDNKLRDAAEQTQRLNATVQEAVNVIQELERVNSSLREVIFVHMNSNQGGSGGSAWGGDRGSFGGGFIPPPDGY